MYLWIGLGVSKNTENSIRKYCRFINKKIKANEHSFSLPQHISLKTSFNTDCYKEIIEILKKRFCDSSKLQLQITGVEQVPGVIWLNIQEKDCLRKYHNDILSILKDKYSIDKYGYDGDTFKFHSTLFQDVDNKDLIQLLYDKIDEDYFKDIIVEVDRIYFGISEIGKVGTYKVVDYIDLK